MRKVFTGLAAALLSTTMIVSAAAAETIRWARASDALTLDPHSQNQGVTHNFAHHIYETLVDRDVEGNLQARLATSWELKAPPKMWCSRWIALVRKSPTCASCMPMWQASPPSTTSPSRSR